MKSACNENQFLYADKSAILPSNKDEHKLHDILQEEFSKIGDWLLDKKLGVKDHEQVEQPNQILS